VARSLEDRMGASERCGPEIRGSNRRGGFDRRAQVPNSGRRRPSWDCRRWTMLLCI